MHRLARPVKPYRQDDEGRVTLYCGDCLMILPELPKVDAVVTDPPYGIAFQSAWRTERALRFDRIVNDGRPFIWWLFHAEGLLASPGPLLCFCRWDSAEVFRLAIEWAGLKIGSQLVWDRVVHGMGDPPSRPSPRHDIIWFAVKGRYRLPATRPTSIYQYQRISADALEHPNQKPDALMVALLQDFTLPAQTVLDPFMGSGTTGVACIRTGRRFIGVEISEEYCAIAQRRIEAELAQGKLEL